MTSKKYRKKYENRRFWPPKPIPKPFQNPFKIEVPKNLQFFIDFGSNFDACCKSQHQKNMRPRSALLIFHTIQLFAFRIRFWSEKTTKNSSKSMPEPFKNRCQNGLLFNIDFFGRRPRFWKVSGIQLGPKLAKNRIFEVGVCSFFILLN